MSLQLVFTITEKALSHNLKADFKFQKKHVFNTVKKQLISDSLHPTLGSDRKFCSWESRKTSKFFDDQPCWHSPKSKNWMSFLLESIPLPRSSQLSLSLSVCALSLSLSFPPCLRVSAALSDCFRPLWKGPKPSRPTRAFLSRRSCWKILL